MHVATLRLRTTSGTGASDHPLAHTHTQTVASLVLWLQTTATAALRRRLMAALFLTVRVEESVLVRAVKRWATDTTAASHHQSAPARLVAARNGARLGRRQLARLRDAVAGQRTATWLGRALVCFAPDDAAAAAELSNVGKAAPEPPPPPDSDPSSYFVLAPAARGDDGTSSGASAVDCLVRLGGRPVWVHAREDGGGAAAQGLLSGAPEPLLALLDRSGLRPLLAPKTDSDKGGQRDGEGDDGRGVHVSVLRWHGAPLVHDVLRAAFAGETTPSRERRLSVAMVQPGKGKEGPTWEFNDDISTRPLDTVVLPAGAAELRDAARLFFSPKYGAFCAAKGIAQRCGYALWGPPGCGKTSFISALTAELGVRLFTLSLNVGGMSNAHLRSLLAAVGRENAVLLIEDIDRLLPQGMAPRKAGLAQAASAGGGSGGGDGDGDEAGEGEDNGDEPEDEEEAQEQYESYAGGAPYDP